MLDRQILKRGECRNQIGHDMTAPCPPERLRTLAGRSSPPSESEASHEPLPTEQRYLFLVQDGDDLALDECVKLSFIFYEEA